MEYDSEILHKDEVKPMRKPSMRDLRMTAASLREQIKKEKALLRAKAKVQELAVKLHHLRYHGNEDGPSF